MYARVLLVVLVLLPLCFAESSCIYCHSNETLMTNLNFSELVFSDDDVWKESKMLRQGLGGPSCEGCHLGNPENFTAEGAHMEMPRPIALSNEDLRPVNRYEHASSLVPQQNWTPASMIPRDFSLNTILYHDRNATTYAFEPLVANDTCGQCHPQQVEDFLTSPMASAMTQSAYPTFTDPPGPHNCGYWPKNLEGMQDELAVEFTKAQDDVMQRVCEQCHTSCLDCHYQPFLGEGVHVFNKKVPATGCESGGGRAICHAGAEDFRRGAGYNRNETAYPRLPDDVHVAENITCTDCHAREGHNFSRSSSCDGCHEAAAEKNAGSVHENLSCEGCHIKELSGYQITLWSPGEYYGTPTPLAKNNYYGSLSSPLLIMDQKGIWIPVKPILHSVMNIEKTLEGTGIKFRDIPGIRNDSRDAFAISGTFSGLPENNNAVLWVHMDKSSHGIGKARSCSDCHQTGSQVIKSDWVLPGEFISPPLKEKVYGTHELVGDESGLYVKYITNTTPIAEEDLAHAYDFAPWIYGATWQIEGDFSLPEKDKDACGAVCESCHKPGHGVITPKYLLVRPYLLGLFIIAAIGLFVLLYIIMERKG